mmetsp:Transcript_6981/g.12800  ORF Transcript_6981/g.12800 Transcript_6981/m.12800 type:complete len:324 (+) Transcript_6981:770-1741(+)
MEAQVSAKNPDIVIHFKHTHLAVVSAKHLSSAPPNSDNSEATPDSISKRRTDTNLGSQGASELGSNRTAVRLKFHSRSSSCSEMKPVYKTPKALSSTDCSSKNSPVKSAYKRNNRSLSLDLSSVIDNFDNGHKRKEMFKLLLQTRTSKAEIKRLYWEDLREERQNQAAARKAVELAEIQEAQRVELEFRQRQERAKRLEDLRHKKWLIVKANENKSIKELSLIQEKLRTQDDITRSLSSSILSSKAKAELKKRLKIEEEERRKYFRELVELKNRERALRADEESRELIEKTKQRIDEMFERTLQENRESLNKLMTAKYARKMV